MRIPAILRRDLRRIAEFIDQFLAHLAGQFLRPGLRGGGLLRRTPGMAKPFVARQRQPRHPHTPFAFGHPAFIRRILAQIRVDLHAAQPREQFVEPSGGQVFFLPRAPCVEPPEMREQQPRVVAAAMADQLAPEPHRLLYPFQRPIGQNRLRMACGQHQCRVPRLRERLVAPPRLVGGMARNPRGGAG